MHLKMTTTKNEVSLVETLWHILYELMMILLLVTKWMQCITCLNSSTPGQNGRLFTDDIFRCILINENFCILVKISLNFVPKGPIDSNPALVQIMA